MKVLDTDTSVEAIRRNPRVLERIDSEAGRLSLVAVSVAELFYGAAKSRDPERERIEVRRFVGLFGLLGLDLASARIFGDTKALLEREGQRLPDADLLIAAICLANRATLVTGNRRHFDRIAGLAMEDWIAG